MADAAIVNVRTGAAAVLSLALAVYVLHEGAALIAPIFASVLLAYALEPLVELLRRARLPRPVAAMLSFLMLAVLIGSLARTTVRQVDAFVGDMPDAIAHVRRLWSAGRERGTTPVDRVREAATEIDRALDTPDPPPARGVLRVQPVAHPFDVRSYLRSWGTSAAVAGGRTLLVALLAFFMLSTGEVYKRKLVALGGTRFAERRFTLEVLHAIDRQIQRYLVVRFLISVIVGVATGVGLWWIGLAHAAAWGAIAGALNVLPFIGPTAAVALITAAAFLQFQTAGLTLTAGGIATAVAALEGNLLTPSLTSRAGDINTVAVFVSVLFWGWLWGIWGLVLAIPITVAAKAAADHIEPLQPLAELLGR